MIVITSMNELPHSCMSCPFQKNQKTPFCRAKRNYRKLSLSNTPPAFGFYIKDDAFLEGQTPWNARAKWCPLVEVKTEPNSSEKPNNCDTCKHNKLEWYSEVCDGCSKAHNNYEPRTCEDCKHNGEKHAYDYACDKCTDMDKFQHEDEPQTERSE